METILIILLALLIAFAASNAKDFLKIKKHGKSLDRIIQVQRIIRSKKISKNNEKFLIEIKKSDVLNDKEILKIYKEIIINYTEIDERVFDKEIYEKEKSIENQEQNFSSNYFKELTGLHHSLSIFTSGLFLATLSLRLSSVDKESVKSNSIIELMLGRKIRNYIKSYKFSILFIAIFTFIHYKFPDIPGTEIGIAVPIIILLATLINQKIVEYRIFNGLYGNNQSEIRELIEFIENHSNPNDFTDGDGLKKLHPSFSKNENVKIFQSGVIV